MKLLVIGAGMMGAAAAYDMARSPAVESVTLADRDRGRAKDAAKNVNKLSGTNKVRPAEVDAENESKAAKLMRDHDAALSAVPFIYNLPLARAAVEARCHFADLGGNNAIVREELALDAKAAKQGIAIAPDCGLSPGMGSILAGELLRRIGGRADALKIYAGGLPQAPKPPFKYQLLFSVHGLINEYAEPARILRKGKIRTVEPLSELEHFRLPHLDPAGAPYFEAFHTSGGTSTMPETFAGKVGECFEKTLRYPGHLAMLRALYELGLFSSEKLKLGEVEVAPRAVVARLMEQKFAGNDPDISILRVEAQHKGRTLAFTMVDSYDPKTRMTAMMRTTAWPASVVVQMMASGRIAKLGALRQELDVPAEAFLSEMALRGINVRYESGLWVRGAGRPFAERQEA